jgi:hypothetical protein
VFAGRSPWRGTPAIVGDLRQVKVGVERALSLVGQAEQHVQRSVDPTVRGGFAAMVVNLHGAQQQLRQLSAVPGVVRDDVTRAAALLASAPEEIDAEQAAAILSPLVELIDEQPCKYHDLGEG